MRDWNLIFVLYLVGAMVAFGINIRFIAETYMEDKKANGPKGALLVQLLTSVITAPQAVLVAACSWIYVGYFLAGDAYQKKLLLVEIKNRLKPLNEHPKERDL